MLLVGCNESSIPLEYKPYQYKNTALATFKSEKGDIYYRNDKVKTLAIDKIDGVNVKTNIYEFKDLNDVSSAFDAKAYSSYSTDVDNPNWINKQNLLVVPVYFTDSSVALDPSLKEAKTTLLQNAFFGDPSYTFYQSVASYYNQSSYGHLQIKGEVASWFAIEQSSSEALKEAKNSPENYSDKVVNKIVESLDETVFAKYSNNHENVLDALYVIYDFPYQEDKRNNEDSLFWAYTYHCKSSTKVSNYAWSSFYFLGENVLETHKVDVSTYIHETGHLFGLTDYYNKGSNAYYQPMGFMDMMDYNLGDHSPLSKFLLNWTSPYILDMGNNKSGEITLRPFSETGDFILIPTSNYNGTAYDRYLLVSYFAPTGLNDLSDFPSYEYSDIEGNKHIFTYPNKYGVLVYEVNAQLGYYKSQIIRSSSPSYFVGETPAAGDYVINFYYDNELSNSSDKPFYHLLESSGQNSFAEGRCASNETLFRYGDTFGINTFQDLAKEFGVTFQISKATMKEAKITFSKL